MLQLITAITVPASAAARRDVIDFVRDGNVLADSAAQRDAAAEMLPHLLAGIARAGLLLPEGR